jgi:hypothetical protein
MSERQDLTRWNRAGLRRFRYVDGAVVEHLETLRRELARRFAAYRTPGEAELGDVDQAAKREDRAQRERRLLEQYQGDRRDLGLEIMRAFARATHVLTEHLDAYANEGYIETATQWDHVRRLVQLLGYHPAPPASAATSLVLCAKPGASGTVERGFQVKHNPADGSAPVVFETLQDLALDHRLGTLYLAGHDRSEAGFDPFAQSASPWRRDAEMALSAGQVAVLVQERGADLPGVGAPPPVARRALAVTLQSLQVDGSFCLGPFASQPDWRKGHTVLLAAPKKVWRPRLNGPRRIVFDRDHGLAAGDAVVWKANDAWHFNAVEAANPEAVVLRPGGVPALGSTVFKAGIIAALPEWAGGSLRLPLDLDAVAQVGPGGVLVPLDLVKQFKTEYAGNGSIPLYLVPHPGVAPPIEPPLAVLAVLRTPRVGQVIALGSPAWRFDFDGSPAGFASGQWVVAEEGTDASGQPIRRAVRIERIEERDGSFTLTLSGGNALAASVERAALDDLQHRLREVEMALDQPVFRALTLRGLALGVMDSRPTSEVQGVGAGHHAPSFAAQQVKTVADLAEMDTSRHVPGVSAVRRREFQAKAQIVRAFRFDAAALAPLMDVPLGDIFLLTPDAVAGSGAVAGADLVQLERLHGPMRHTLRPLGHDCNDDPVLLPVLSLALDADESGRWPDGLKKGRVLLLESVQSGASGPARLAVIDRVDGNRLTLAKPWPDLRGFTLGKTVLNGNVVPAGHGESRTEKMLGSGNAARLHQEFVLDVTGISFVADSSMPAGVRADLSVVVDGRTWQQVGTLADSGPADAHYTVRVTEERTLRIAFGDGRHGRRLPTGTNNVRAVYRVGCGLGGNLPVGNLVQPSRPHRLVAAVRQPQPSIGGNDLESVASLRTTAPASLLTLERAVSLSDFAHLAASQASVWQARAFSRITPAGRREGVEVVVVPAGGAELDPTAHTVDEKTLEHLLNQQAEFLRAHALPATAVTVRAYVPVLVDLDITVAVKSAEFDTERTLEAVRVALRSALALRARQFGQPLHRSELYKVVEAVQGVENSNCRMTLTPGGRTTPTPLRVLPRNAGGDVPVETLVPAPRQVIHVDALYSTVRVGAQEFAL